MPHLAVLFVLSAASSPCPDLNLIHYNLQEHAHLLSNTQKQVIAGAEELISKLPPSFQIQAKINLYDKQLQQLDKHPKQYRDLDIDR